jgi:hypothetical protein
LPLIDPIGAAVQDTTDDRQDGLHFLGDLHVSLLKSSSSSLARC